MDIFPEGDPPSSPGLLYSATLGTRAASSPTPTGLWLACSDNTNQGIGRRVSSREFIASFTWSNAATPLGLRRSSRLFPKVAEYSNLGLWATTTSWLNALRQEDHVYRPRRRANPPSVRRALEFGHFPRTGSVLQPRVAVLGYPGNAGGEFANPNGVVATPVTTPIRGSDEAVSSREFIASFTWSNTATPSGLQRSSRLFPKVAAYSNLGLWATTTSWLNALRQEGYVYRTRRGANPPSVRRAM